MRQLSFLGGDPPPVPDGPRGVDAGADLLLGTYRAKRLAAGAHPRSVARELSQLRAVARECGGGEPAPFAELLADPRVVARALLQPRCPVARSTNRARLVAFQRFVRIVGPCVGRDPDADAAALDALLPARRDRGWHTAGTVVGGGGARRRALGPTLDPADLARLVEAAAVGAPRGCAERDRALVSLLCFTGLRAEEIVRLRWEDLTSEHTSADTYGLTAASVRAGRAERLRLPRPAADALVRLAGATGDAGVALRGPVIRARGAPLRPLGYRGSRKVLRRACERAGLPPLESAELRAACAHWLRTQGLSDHEVAAVLGLRRVRSVDRLLQRHAALGAQRRAREVLGE